MRNKDCAMSYKTILAHVDKSDSASERIRLAAMIALNENAHLTGIAVTGISRFIYQAALINDNDPNLTTHLTTELDILRERAKIALNDFARIAQKMHVRSFETLLVDDEAGAFTRHARCNDLIVIGQTDPEEPSPAVTPDFPEHVVLNSGRPLLIAPYAGRFDRFGSKVMIAWDASAAAARAVAYALPILRRADIVEVVVFNLDDAQLGPDVVHYLAHHDVKADVIRQETDIDVGNSLLSMATDLNSDAIVMGAYGHSRLREKLLGGVTRTVLESMTVPVLMSN
jgi:nucleotide-binding universal stress UspA family protein